MLLKTYIESGWSVRNLISRNTLVRGVLISRRVPYLEQVKRYLLKDRPTGKMLTNDYIATLDVASSIPDKNTVIYVSIYSDPVPLPGEKRGQHLKRVIELIRDKKGYKYLICSDLGDEPFDQGCMSSLPDNVLKVYSLNASVFRDRVTCFPIGINNPHELEQIRDQFTVLAAQYSQKRKKKLICCGPFGMGDLTYPVVKPKKMIRRNLERAKILLEMEEKPWLSVKYTRMSFNQYVSFLSEHRFVISPIGKGMDCHRTWEALYLKSIPVLTKKNYLQCYNDLPILYVNDYRDLTKDYLKEQYEVMLNSHYNFDKLEKRYWDNVIDEGEAMIGV